MPFLGKRPRRDESTVYRVTVSYQYGIKFIGLFTHDTRPLSWWEAEQTIGKLRERPAVRLAMIEDRFFRKPAINIVVTTGSAIDADRELQQLLVSVQADR